MGSKQQARLLLNFPKKPVRELTGKMTGSKAA